MHFDQFLADLPGVPLFQRFRYRDTNPLTGTTKYRQIGAPNPAMLLLHQRFVRALRALPVEMPHAVGARPNGSPLNNVRRHRYPARQKGRGIYLANRHFYLLDIVDAYGHVDDELLAFVLCGLDPKPDTVETVHAFLKKYCFVSGSSYRIGHARQQTLAIAPPTPIRRGSRGLVQGSPSSPDLFNIYAATVLDRQLATICTQHELTYTRYLDDLTFSSRHARITDQVRREIRATIATAGFQISHRKAQVVDLYRGPITINGISLDRHGRVFLPRWYVRKLRGLLHAAQRDPNIRPEVVHGKMGVFLGTLPYIHGVGHVGQNATEKKLLELYASYRTHVQRR